MKLCQAVVDGWKQENGLEEGKLGIGQEQTSKVGNLTVVQICAMCSSNPALQDSCINTRFTVLIYVVCPSKTKQIIKKALSVLQSLWLSTYLCWWLRVQALFQTCLSLCCNCLEMYTYNFIVVFNCIKISNNTVVLCQSHSTLNKTNHYLPLSTFSGYKHRTAFAGQRTFLAIYSITKKIFPGSLGTY